MDELPEVKMTWKRPANIKYPNVWHRFETKERAGKSYKIRIEDVTEDRFNEAFEFFMKYYFNNKPLSVASKLMQDELSMMNYRYLLSTIMTQNVSIIAVIDDDSPRPEIVGLQILSVASKEDSPLPEVPGKAATKFHKLYAAIRKNCDAFEKLATDSYLREWGLCVATEMRRLGIALNILNTLTSIGRAYGLVGTMIMFSRIESQQAAEKTGFKLYNEIVYADYKDDDGNVLIDETRTLKLMGKKF